MKIGLPLKLGIFVIVLFALVIAGCLLYRPLRYFYWRSRLSSENKAVRDKAVKTLIAMPPGYHDRLVRDCLDEGGKYSIDAAKVLVKSETFDFTSLGLDDFLTFVRVVDSSDEVRKERPEGYYLKIKKHLESIRPEGRNRRYYDTYHFLVNPLSKSGFSNTEFVFLHFGQIKPDGYWYSEDGTHDGDLAVTGLTFLTFLGHGQTHRHGKFKKTMRRGLTYLGKAHDRDGKYSESTYVQAVCTKAICEVYAVTRDTALKKPAKQVLANLLARQLPGGGFPEKEGGETPDPKSTIWSVFATLSAKFGKVDFDDEMFERVLTYFDNQGLLTSEKEEDLQITAGAAIAGVFCGRKRTHPSLQKAFKTLGKYLPSWENRRDVDYIYLGTYAKFQQGDPDWKPWREAMRRALLNNQHVKGRLEGSWDPVMGPSSRKYGRNYTTAMCILALQLYLRYARATNYMKKKR